MTMNKMDKLKELLISMFYIVVWVFFQTYYQMNEYIYYRFTIDVVVVVVVVVVNTCCCI
jgi:hypothetical protein